MSKLRTSVRKKDEILYTMWCTVLIDEAEHSNSNNEQKDDVHLPTDGLEKSTTDERQVNKEKFQPNHVDPIVNKREKEVKEDTKPKQVTRKKMSGTKKFLLIVASIIGIALIGTYQFFKTQYDPIRTLQKIEQAITDDNHTSFSNHFSFKEKAILDEEAFFKYVRDNEWDYNLKYEMLNYFENETVHSSGLDYIIESDYGDKFIVIREKPVLFGLFKNYEFLVEPTELYLETNIHDTEVSIHNESVKLSPGKEKKVTIYPGKYAITGDAENNFGQFMYSGEAVIEAVKDIYYFVEFDYRSYYVDAWYNYSDAVVFIDGKSTKKTIKDFGYLEPVPEDSKVKVHAEWKSDSGAVLKSNSYSLNALDTNQLYFDFDETKAIVADAKHLDDEDAGRFVLDFRDAYEDAVNYADYSAVEHFLEPDGHNVYCRSNYRV